ncbi:MAG TPA: hypothetical protein DFS52_26740, partial [Myxococcales bacterium]|nr:hypothetical protein [Myxococcales bacterium]
MNLCWSGSRPASPPSSRLPVGSFEGRLGSSAATFGELRRRVRGEEGNKACVGALRGRGLARELQLACKYEQRCGGALIVGSDGREELLEKPCRAGVIAASAQPRGR